ncbi:hypothetical protein [Actinoplanes missouriensis]|uniref:hypothetical protein n=1 Tax=Actinoplanes missouriensis TaxID=1866 RepID=UPI0012FB2096|nr:hypothetical protein [Actinoplanes missouriensis]
MRRYLVIPVLLLLATACSAQPVPQAEPPSPSPSSSPDPEVTLPVGYIGGSEASEPPSAGPAALRGAGWSLRTDQTQTGPFLRTVHPVVDLRTGEQTVGNYLIGYAMMRAPQGQELIVAPLGKPDDLPGAPVTIRAGDRQQKITKLTQPVLVLTVPSGAPATLTVEDGRPQTLDLRTGRRVPRADTALFYDPPAQEKTDGPQIGIPGATGLFLSASAELVPGLESVGYADPGKAWLAVTVEAGGAECDLKLGGSSFRFESGGRSYPATGSYRLDMSLAAGSLSIGAIEVAIEVPEKVRAGTLVFALSGTRTGGDCGTGRLTTVPARATMRLKLS